MGKRTQIEDSASKPSYKRSTTGNWDLGGPGSGGCGGGEANTVIAGQLRE